MNGSTNFFATTAPVGSFTVPCSPPVVSCPGAAEMERTTKQHKTAIEPQILRPIAPRIGRFMRSLSWLKGARCGVSCDPSSANCKSAVFTLCFGSQARMGHCPSTASPTIPVGEPGLLWLSCPLMQGEVHRPMSMSRSRELELRR